MKKLFTFLLLTAISVGSFAQKQELSVYMSETETEIKFPMYNRADAHQSFKNWITWDKDNHHGNAVGANGPFEAAVASRWTPKDLEGYHGWKITQMMITAGKNSYETAEYILKIWTGTTPTEVYSQPIEVTEGDVWLVYNLDEPYTIDASQELWFGYWVNAQKGHPAGCDEGPAVDEKGNKIFIEGKWQSLNDLTEGSLNYNWCIRAFVEMETNIESLDKYEVNVHPNPFSDYIHIQGHKQIVSVSISSLTGQIVLHKQLNGEQTIQVSHLPKGIYLVTLTDQNKQKQVVRMIK